MCIMYKIFLFSIFILALRGKCFWKFFFCCKSFRSSKFIVKKKYQTYQPNYPRKRSSNEKKLQVYISIKSFSKPQKIFLRNPLGIFKSKIWIFTLEKFHFHLTVWFCVSVIKFISKPKLRFSCWGLILSYYWHETVCKFKMNRYSIAWMHQGCNSSKV